MKRSRPARLLPLVFAAATVAATTVAAGEASPAPGASPCAVAGPEVQRAAVPYPPLDDAGGPTWRPAAGDVETSATAAGDLRVTFRGDRPATFTLDRPVPGVSSLPLRAEFAVRLEGWSEVSSVAVGWQGGDGRFLHDRVKHVDLGDWLEVAVDPASIAFQLANGWAAEPSSPESLRIVVEGVPGRGAHLDVGPVLLRPSRRFGEYPIGAPGCLVTPSSLRAWLAASGGRAPRLDPKSFLVPDADPIAVARALHERNEYRLTYLPPFPGDPSGGVPAGALATNTSRFRWHALDVVVPLLAAFRLGGEDDYLALARREAQRWLDANFAAESTDLKYAWYDHGAANRLVALLLLWEQGVAQGFDPAFMERLAHAVHAHAELLASPSFYLRNQPVRYHNHGVFQDLALLAAVRAMPELAAAYDWRAIAMRRLRGQLDGLVTSEGVSVENSWGYHLALASLCDTTVERLIALGEASGVDGLRRECQRMDLFSRSMRYPDGGAPTYGDTRRSSYLDRRLTPPDKPSAGTRLFPESGYAALWGGPHGRRVQLDVVNSSRTLTHKHNDFLSFTLWFAGAEWLIDPGYHSADERHGAFAAGATAHNTVLPCGLSFAPAVDVTTLAAGPPESGAQTVTSRYRPRPDLTVERRFVARFDRGSLVVDDAIVGECGPAASEIWFQLDDGVAAEAAGHDLRLRREGSGATLLLELPKRAECEVYRGQLEPFVAGWYYPSFAETRATTAIRCRLPAGLKRWRTTFTFRAGSDG